MKYLTICVLVVAFVCIQSKGLPNDEVAKARKTRSVAAVWRRFADGVQKRTFTCKEMLEECHGSIFDRCCRDMICYREEDLAVHEIFDEGYCVECVDRGQICQKDKQCCGELVCVKDKLYNINGLCEPRLGHSEHCHHDDECQSGNCERKHFWSFHGFCKD